MEKQNDLSFVNVTGDLLKTIINKAKYRIIFAKPAFHDWEINLIQNIIMEKDILCELYFESNDNSIRFGFGEAEALKRIKDDIENFSVHIVNRIRLSILIIDNETLIFSPEIIFLDGEGITNEFPNGVFGGKSLTKKIMELLSLYKIESNKASELQIDLFDIPHVDKEQQNSVLGQIKETLVKLNENPPTNPNKLKKVYFYRNKYKLLKFELQGTNFQNKKLNLNPFIKILQEQNERLKSSWTIFSKEDASSLRDMILFEEAFYQLIEEYLVDMGRFGYLIQVEKKKEFDSRVEELKNDFKSFINGSAQNNNVFYKKSNGKSNIKLVLNTSKLELINYLYSISKNSSNKIISHNRHLFNMVEDGVKESETALKEFIEEFVDNKLKFPVEQEIIDRVNVRVDYYDISDELLYENTDFQDKLQKEDLLDIDLRENKQGYQEKGPF